MVSQESLSKDNSEPGLSFASPNAPYLRSLEHRRRGDPCVYTLAKALEDRIRNAQDGTGHLDASHKTPVTQMIDFVAQEQPVLRRGCGLNRGDLSKAYRHDPVALSRVEAFFTDLRDFESHTQTRLLVLQSSDIAGKDQKALADLLFTHILGVELGLGMEDVHMLADLRAWWKGKDVVRFPVQPGLVYFGDPSRGLWSYIGLHLSRPQLGGGRPSLVVLRLGTQGETSDIIQCLREQIKAHGLKTGHGEAGHWLAVLVDATCDSYSSNLDATLRDWHELRESGTQHKRRELWLRMKHDEACIQASIDQAEALQEHAGYQHSDPSFIAARQLRRMHKEYSAQTEEIKTVIDNEMQVKSMEVAQMSINESRSAIAVTVLAFIFVPINLASSIFGMNIQQINATGHSIWAFLITALAMLGVSVLAWVSWRAARNWRQVYVAARRDGVRWENNNASGRFELLREKYQAKEHSTWRRRIAWFGMRAIEKGGSLPFE